MQLHTANGRKWLDHKVVKAVVKGNLLFELIYYYGMRRGEPGLLKPAHLTEDGLLITRLKRRELFQHLLPLPAMFRDRLLERFVQNSNGDWLFPGYKGQGISGSAVAKQWHELCRQSGLFKNKPLPKCHSLRHSCAMSFFSLKGRPIEECRAWLGHATGVTTEVYYTVEATRLNQIAKEIESEF